MLPSEVLFHFCNKLSLVCSISDDLSCLSSGRPCEVVLERVTNAHFDSKRARCCVIMLFNNNKGEERISFLFKILF